MDCDEVVQNTKQVAPAESGADDLNEISPLLKKEALKRHVELKPPSTAMPGRHWILGAFLGLLGAVWLAQIYNTEPVSPPYAVCTSRKSVVYTVDPARPTAQCILVNEQGRIADIGSAGAQILPLIH